MDVGMHTGEDTARFLARGHKVVAVEANPRLVAAASEKFSKEIHQGQLTIINAAIADRRGTASFGIASDTIWSTFDPELVARNERAGATYEYIDVETMPFEDVLGEYGVPYYLKVDIEGLDMMCVRALHTSRVRPMYVSIESAVSTGQPQADAVFGELAELWTLGYRRFRYVQQAYAPDDLPGEADHRRWHSAATAVIAGQVLRVQHNFAGYGGRWADTLPARVYAHARWRLRRQVGWFDLVAAYP